MLDVQNISYRARSMKWLVRDINFKVDGSQFICIIGPNGAGKSTLLRMISREISPYSGRINLLDRDLRDFDPIELAQIRAYLAQKRNVTFPYRALQIVLLGRHPYLQGAKETEADLTLAQQKLEILQSNHLADQNYLTLSGGESTRVDMARSLAQEPRLLLLDEPTNNLDPYHQLELLNLCKSLALHKKTVIAVMHDLNLVAQYADQVLLLSEGKLIIKGKPEDVFDPIILRDIYGVDFEIWHKAQGELHVFPVKPAAA